MSKNTRSGDGKGQDDQGQGQKEDHANQEAGASKAHRVVTLPALNSLKHGVYAELTVLPTEDRQEFENHRQEVIDELQPNGPLERDVVHDVVKFMWRKRRLHTFRLMEALRPTLTSWLQAKPADRNVKVLTALLENLQNLKISLEMKPILNEGLDAAAEVTEQLYGSLGIPTVSNPTRDDCVRLLLEAKELESLAMMAGQITRESFIQELELENRLDAMIERRLKRLFQLKEMKQMTGLTNSA